MKRKNMILMITIAVFGSASSVYAGSNQGQEKGNSSFIEKESKIAAPFIPGGAIVSAEVRGAYSPQVATSQRLKLKRAREIVNRNRRCQAYRRVADDMAALIKMLASNDQKLANKKMLKNKNELAALKQSQKVISGKYIRIKSSLKSAASTDRGCSRRSSISAIQPKRTGDKGTKQQVEAQFKLALKILSEHMERQTQVAQKLVMD